MGKVPKYNTARDGTDHLNVYSRAKTELGRFLSNFAYSPIETEDGHFDSIEGYWYWLGTAHPNRDRLRTLSGNEAKEYGRFIGAKEWGDTEEFENKIKAAIRLKLNANPALFQQLRELRLPLTHYYVYGDKIVNVSGAKWILDFLESFKQT